MQVRIQNYLLNEAIEFFYNLKLKGRQSRMRSKLIRMLNTRAEEFVEQQKELLKEHCNLENGEPKIIKNEQGVDVYDIKDLEAYGKDRQELFSEEYVIEGADNDLMIKTVRTVLDECDIELSGRKAVLYEQLCEIFKVDEQLEEETEDN